MTDVQLATILWNYMRIDDPLEKADVIVGFGSHNPSTAQHAATLLFEGWAPKIVFTGGLGKVTHGSFEKPEAEIYADIAMNIGVPREEILIEPASTNSGENIRYTEKLLQESGLKADKLILVHKPYMLRRAYATLMAQWLGEKPVVLCSGVKEDIETYCARECEDSKIIIELMVGDLQRIREYPKYGWQIPQEIPDDVWAAYGELVKRGYVKHLLN